MTSRRRINGSDAARFRHAATRAVLAISCLLSALPAQAAMNMWRRGEAAFGVVLYLQNTGSETMQCSLSWGNATGGFGGSTTLIVKAGETSRYATNVIAVNETYRCQAYVDPFAAQRAREEEARKRAEEARRKQEEEKAQAAARRASLSAIQRDNARQADLDAARALQDERARNEAQMQADMQRRHMQEMQAQQEKRAAALHAQYEQARQREQQRQRQMQQNFINNQMLQNDTANSIASQHRRNSTYASENAALEQMLREMERNR